MDRNDVISRLQGAWEGLRSRYGLHSLSLFGSLARSDDGAASDVDILVAFEPGARVTLMTLASLKCALEDTLMAPVDLVEDHPRLRPSFRHAIEKDLLRVA